MAKSRIRTRTLTDKVERISIWENFQRHCTELKQIGATDEDLLPLKAAAEAVSEAEKAADLQDNHNPVLEHSDLPSITAPHECANGWTVQPPSLVAKRWAATAVMKVTGGEEPDDPLGQAYALLAGLWVLKTWGDGHKDVVMQTVCAPGRLAEALPNIEDSCDDEGLAGLASDYTELMGFAKKKLPEMEMYQKRLSELRDTFSRSSTAAS